MTAPIDENRVTYFGETDARNRRLKFGIKAKDRTKHVYVIGKTGMGKSTLLENMAVQDIQNGEGMCFIDPHGKTADLLLEYVPKERVKDVIYIAPFDTDHPISFNVLESVDPAKRHLVVSGLMSTFKKIWVDAWSARMEYILTNTLLALLEAPNTTLLGVNRMLSDKAYRNQIISSIQDPSVKSFWTKEFAGYTERMAAEAVPAIQNKVGQFTANPLIRNMIGQPVSSFDFREAMDSRKIMIINLSKGKIGDENMKLLGGLLVTKIYLAAMSRADVPDRVMKMLPNFYLFVDEFQNFANASFADILSEARKYKLNLTIAHQYIEQMDEVVRPAVFGNVGTMIAFRVGATDAEVLEKEFAPQFTIEDLVNLGFAQIYLKLMIDGLSSSPFSAVTLPPIPHPDISYVGEIIDSSRRQFAKPRAEVEVEIIKFHEPTVTSRPASSLPPTARVPVPPPPPPPPTLPLSGEDAKVVPRPTLVQTRSPAAPPQSSQPSLSPKPPPSSQPPVKPVPLSSLAAKPQIKSDPKVPSPQHVDALKNALATALAKGKPEAPKQESPKPPPAPKPSPPAPKPESPREVPEDVLKKVLKLE
jgi:energy-coupling factor transporter ATP-binding protein EcfA2